MLMHILMDLLCTLVAFLNIFDNSGSVADKFTLLGASHLTVFVFGSFSAMAGRQYVRDMAHLSTSLANFSWESAECRDDGDYAGLGTLLVHWFGGVAQFEMFVSHEFRDTVLQKSGGKNGIFYAWTLPVCLATFCCLLDYVALQAFSGHRDIVGHISLWVYLFTSSFFITPLTLKVFLRLCESKASTSESYFVELLSNVSICFATYLFAAVAIGIATTLDVEGSRLGSTGRLLVILHMCYDVTIVYITFKN